jgi:phosphate transport system substrate-binding protein
VDIGMLSRPLKKGERALGLVVIPVAQDAVVFAVNKEVEVENLNTAELLSLYSGQQKVFADNTPVSLLLRDRQESANFAMDRMVPALAKIREENYSNRRFRVIYHEDSMAVALATTPGGMGLLSTGAIQAGKLPIKALSLNGIQPSLTTIADGSWPATRKLAFIVRPDRLASMEQFLRFVSSADGCSTIQESGYLSVHEGPQK